MLKLTNQWLEEGEAKGIAIGEAQGIAVGEAQAQRRMVLKMHQRGFEIALISSLTELSLNEVEELISTSDTASDPL